MKRKLIGILLILSFSFFPFFNAYADEGYEIDNYNVNVVVNEDHSLNIVETIDVNFKSSRHGIKRNLPKRNTYKREIDGQNIEVNAEAAISDYSVNEQYTTEGSNLNEIVLKIGDPNKTITGKKQYIIKYKYDMGEDYITSFDDLYYNIIGTSWDCKIKNVTFKIKMPKDFDTTKINFTIGRYGATYNKDITYKIENNEISGSIIPIDGYALGMYEGLTVRVELPEGYFVNEKEHEWYNNPKGKDFDFEKINIKANLKENNTMHVEEEYSIKFNRENAYFYRNIKYKGYIYRKIDNKDKKQSINYKITNIKGNSKVYSDKYDGKYMISYLSDKVETDKVYNYTLSYDIDFGDDLVDIGDIFLYEFKNNYSPVRDFNLELTLPKEVDRNDILVIDYDSDYDEKYYHTYLSNRKTFNYEDNTIKVSFNKNYWGYSLESSDNVAIRIELPEGYFKGERNTQNNASSKIINKIIIVITMLFVTGLLYLVFGLRKKGIQVVSYTAPDNLTPSEVGYIYSGKVKNNHIIALITYFANKGYLKIESKSKNDFELTKVKAIPASEPGYAVTTFNGLFSDGKTATKKNLRNSFYLTLDRAKNSLKKKYKMYTNMHYVSIVVYSIVIVSLLTISSMEATFKDEYVFTKEMLNLDNIFRLLYYISLILNILFIIFSKKRSEETSKLYDKVMGFRDFLVKVEKDKLEMLVEENPNYFYDILPYTYVLGISKKWIKKFESIAIAPPNWYTGNMYNINTGVFDVNKFSNSLTHTLAATSVSMSSRPYESSGGGYSGGGSFSGGGGSSGGGGGGGGGSSW